MVLPSFFGMFTYLFVDAEDSIEDENDVVVLIGLEVARTAATAIAE